MDNEIIKKWLSGYGYGSGDGYGSGSGSGYGDGYGDGSGSGSGSGYGDGSGYGYGDGSGSGSGSGYGDGSGYGYGYGSGSGDGYGYGYGSGDGYGSGSGSGYGDGYGDGSGDGYGYGYGSGDGYGSGSGSGYGDGYGDGSGDGYGSKHTTYENNTIFYIDNIPTIITNIIDSYAKGYIINRDFSKSKCYVAKGNGFFAHGETLKEAVNSLQEKIMQNMSEEERIAEFCKAFDKDKSYRGNEFFDWHNRLTGSCLFGRNQFIKDNNLSLNKNYTVKEFITLTENAYGGDIIKKLKKYYN